MNEEQVKKIRKVLKTDLKDFLKIMKDNQICKMRLENEEKTLGVELNYQYVREDTGKEFNEKVDKCLEKIDKLEDIKSHLVGKFYIGTNSSGEFYKSGDKITKGKVIGFIEMMNIMHEVAAASDGEIINILADNGKVVEYGQPLLQYRVN